MTLALLGVAVVVFSLLCAVIHTISERRTHRQLQEQWEERERSLNRKP